MVYDPTDEPDGDDDRDAFEVALAKASLRKELGLTSGPRNVGDSTTARIDHNLRESLRRAAARDAVDAEAVREAREAADPEGLLTDADVRDVLEREGLQ